MNRRLAGFLALLPLAGCDHRDAESARPANAPPAAPKAVGASVPSSIKEPVKAVDWRALSRFLKDAPGSWQAVAPATGAAAVASRDYKDGEKSVHVQIFDSSINPMFAAGVRAAQKSAPEGGDHGRRPLEVAGQPGFEEWAPPAGGKVTLLAGDRFIVEIRGTGIEGCASLRALAGALELDRLATLGR